MEIVSERIGQTQVVHVHGELDAKTAPDAQSKILSFAVSGEPLIVDLQQVPFVSSAGLRMLLLLYRQFSASRGRLVLVGLSDRVRDTMDTTGFLGHFSTYRDVSEGLSSLQG